MFGARLRITALRGGRGARRRAARIPRARTGRAAAADTLASDLWHWQVSFVRDDLDGVDAAVKAASGRPGAAGYVSPGVVRVDARAGRGASALTLRDPDGHAAVLWTNPPDHPSGDTHPRGASYGQ